MSIYCKVIKVSCNKKDAKKGESRVEFLIGTVIFTILQKMQNFYRVWQGFLYLCGKYIICIHILVYGG